MMISYGDVGGDGYDGATGYGDDHDDGYDVGADDGYGDVDADDASAGDNVTCDYDDANYGANVDDTGVGDDDGDAGLCLCW